MDESKKGNNQQLKGTAIMMLCILFFLPVFLGLVAYIQHDQIRELKKEIAEFEYERSELLGEIETLQKEHQEGKEKYMSLLLDYSEKLIQCEFFDENAAIVTVEGEVYHKYNCYHWKGSDIYIYNTELAEYKGYRACYDCQ